MNPHPFGRTLRVDFNHSNLNYYTAIDAIMLCGRTVDQPRTLLAKRRSEHLQRQLLVHLSPPPEAPNPHLDPPNPDGSGGPISCKLRTLKFQPSWRDGAGLDWVLATPWNGDPLTVVPANALDQLEVH